MKTWRFLLLFISFFIIKPIPTTSSGLSEDTHVCEVVINGGSLSALAAAFSASDNGSQVCLIEQTDWVGGQLTSQGVSALDFPYQKTRGLKVNELSLQDQHIPKNLRPILKELRKKSASCWVSKFCAKPSVIARDILHDELESRPNITVFYNSVVKKVQVVDNSIQSVDILTRDSFDNNSLYSQQVESWYDTSHSRTTLTHPTHFVVIDASDIGDIIVLSGSDFMQGSTNSVEEHYGDRCGQAITYPVALEVTDSITPSNLPSFTPQEHSFDLNGMYFNWNRVWKYRLVNGKNRTKAQAGDISLHNWESGNNYNGGYVFLDTDRTLQQRSNWKGGLDLTTLKNAENQSYSWSHKVILEAPIELYGRIAINSEVQGTHHGLSKVPYFRDGRRIMGEGGFMLSHYHIKSQNGLKRGTKFDDRIATGAYPIDIHRLEGCEYTPSTTDVVPYYIPYRSMHNGIINNLIVAGKNIAQDYVVSSSTRIHVTEFKTGSAAGVIASELQKNSWTATQGGENIIHMQEKIKPYTPIEWNL